MWRFEKCVQNFNQRTYKVETIWDDNSIDGMISVQWILNKLGMIGELELDGRKKKVGSSSSLTLSLRTLFHTVGF
jgi:hypothetical protein